MSEEKKYPSLSEDTDFVISNKDKDIKKFKGFRKGQKIRLKFFDWDEPVKAYVWGVIMNPKAIFVKDSRHFVSFDQISSFKTSRPRLLVKQTIILSNKEETLFWPIDILEFDQIAVAENSLRFFLRSMWNKFKNSTPHSASWWEQEPRKIFSGNGGG